MQAVVYDAFGAQPGVRAVPDPEPEPHGVVLRVTAAGLCRSDWHGWMGHDPDIVALPHVPGHELAGVVEAVGADVRRVRVGERVTVPFACACGTCTQCRDGAHQICDRQRQPGFAAWGAFAERVAIPWADVNVIALPDAISDAVAALLGCRVATAYRALFLVGRLRAGERVAVHGCGGLGLAAVMLAAAAGARVVAIDPAPEARALAADLGAEDVLDDGAAVKDVTDGGADLSVDAAGAAAALVASVHGLRKRGRHVQAGLLPTAPAVPMDVVIGGELQLLGSHGLAAHAYPALLGLVTSGRIDPARLVTAHVDLHGLAAALPRMDGAGVTLWKP